MRMSRAVYLAAAWLFAAGVIVQVFFIGMAVVAYRWSTAPHVALGQGLVIPMLAMVVGMFPARYPRTVKALTWLLLATYILQAGVLIQLRGAAPALSALHPVLALVDIVLVWELMRRAVRAPAPAPKRAAAPRRGGAGPGAGEVGS